MKPADEPTTWLHWAPLVLFVVALISGAALGHALMTYDVRVNALPVKQ